MLGFLQRRKRSGGAAVGIAFGPEGVTAARLAPGGRDEPPRLLACDELVGAPDAVERDLSRWVERYGATRAPAVGVLAAGDYQVLSIEAPPVAAAEMRRAVGWQIRELLDYPVNEAVIDIFEPPASAQRGRRSVYVVAAPRATVAARVDLLSRAGLVVDAIDVPELAQRDISFRLTADEGHALLALHEDEGLLTVFRGGEHYLARTLDVGLSALAANGPNATEALVLEVQRSFDYFESTLSQPPLGTLLLFPAGHASDLLAREVVARLSGIACHPIAVEDIVAVEEEPVRAGTATLHALGAALRASGQALGAAA